MAIRTKGAFPAERASERAMRPSVMQAVVAEAENDEDDDVLKNER